MSFRLKIWQIERTCVFELSWGQGQQLTAKLPYLPTLTTLYQNWQQAYLNFYQSAVRARVGKSGTLPKPEIDWRAKLVQAEAKLLAEFHLWLSQAELLEMRREIARAAQDTDRAVVDVFLTCDSVELERLPWEVWEPGTEFAAKKTIRIARTPARIRADRQQRQRQGKMRVLAILGDDTGLNFQADQAAVKSLAHLAEIHFVGWQQGEGTTDLKETIRQTIAAEPGWDILFFAGHSNEAALTGGELAIAPNQSIFLSEIAPQLVLAKERGLQLAIFNSCRGLSLAQTLVDLGLSQVAVMREPIHNLVAQEFLVRFVQSLSEFKDGHEALLDACKYLKLEKNLTYPSAYLIPSLFRHPDSAPFQLKPFGWQEQLKQWLPTKQEAIALLVLMALSLFPALQQWLLEQRVMVQAMYRQTTGQMGKPTVPPLLLVQIDDRSLQKARIANPRPMRRDYLAKLVNQLSALDARVVGIDFWLDRPHAEDVQLQQALVSAIQQQNTWFVFVVQESSKGEWLMVTPDVAKPTWSLQGNGWVPFWYLQPLPWLDSTPLPFSYWLATAYRLQNEPLPANASLPLPSPNLPASQELGTQIKTIADRITPANHKPLLHSSMQLQPITAFSYLLHQHWFKPLIDFSIPPDQVYDPIPAWQLLEQPEMALKSRQLSSLRSRLVMIAAGGYDEAGVAADGEDNFPVPAAITYWRNQPTPTNDSRIFSGGEAHAYMTHHYLTHRFVIPIPDLWLVLIVIPVSKGLSLLLSQSSKRRWLILSGIAPLGFGLISLQVYITAGVLIPWLLPSITIWTYTVLTLQQRNHA
ncbi:CHASE2 domain-containing protein [Pantanalinema sp. GBBB05]|uniref:CHASE2 domain-containing protein n=1 Tax=Pantanalinema sp. GBBB05 TaxID=2604139 RepID=UPI001D3120C9|nr:CHASE2 domain-containing protein [Pantanalinema sp. GBBB05]